MLHSLPCGNYPSRRDWWQYLFATTTRGCARRSQMGSSSTRTLNARVACQRSTFQCFSARSTVYYPYSMTHFHLHTPRAPRAIPFVSECKYSWILYQIVGWINLWRFRADYRGGDDRGGGYHGDDRAVAVVSFLATAAASSVDVRAPVAQDPVPRLQVSK